MKYNDKSVAQLTNDELSSADTDLNTRLEKLREVQETPQFKKKFKNQPLPPVNPVFLELHNAIKTEIQKRNDADE